MIALVAAVVLTAVAPFDVALDRATEAYRQAEFEVALRELALAEPLADTDARKVQVYVLQGIVLANVPNLEAASTTWERALTLDSEATLPFAVSTKVRTEFERVQRAVQRIKSSLVKPNVSAVVTPVAEAPVVAKVPVTRFVVSGVSLGLGVVSAGLGAVFGVSSNGQYQSAKQATYADEKRAQYAAAQSSALWANVGFVSAGVFALGAILTYLLIPAPTE